MNIGVRPTIGGNNHVNEVHLINFDKMIYGEKLTVYVKRKIIDEVKFESFVHFKTQLFHDKMKTIEILND